ncbi:hypothetical protein CVT25_005601 [Psilocybe cyanescens]|uniref:Uncharacterized protein n=1 Tax=Psilocybe cyanescens TaxID=93625 RepID=A0A409X6C1_PSICY|nr:hypothetical protein CVT25_005601 [Psilocybe cyanescens]
MKFIASSFAVAALCVSSALASLIINTPVDNPGNEAPIVDLGQQTGHTAIWNTAVAPGTVVSFLVRDSTGAFAQSAPVTVQAY